MQHIFCVAINDPYVMSGWGDAMVRPPVLSCKHTYSDSRFLHPDCPQGIGGKKRNGVRVGGGKIRMVGDPRGELARALGMEADLTKELGGVR